MNTPNYVIFIMKNIKNGHNYDTFTYILSILPSICINILRKRSLFPFNLTSFYSFGTLIRPFLFRTVFIYQLSFHTKKIGILLLHIVNRLRHTEIFIFS
jgi:hypothetical protein